MKRSYQPWLAAGMVLTSLTGSRLAHGQASPQGPSQAAHPSPQVVGGFPGKALPSYPTGATSFPRGYDSPSSMAPQGASPQSGLNTSYGQISSPTASGQYGAAGTTPSAPFIAPLSEYPGAGALPSLPAGVAAGGAMGNAFEPGTPGTSFSGAGAAAGGAGAGGMGAGAGASSETAAEGAAAFEAAIAGLAGPGGAGASESNFPPNMIGDLTPVSLRAFQNQGPPTVGPPTVGPPPLPGVRSASLFYPTVRIMKMSENQSPRPQDRFFYDFNYYNNVNAASNLYNRSPIKNMEVFRHMFGFEKTFDEGRGSFGMRLPIDTLTADGTVRGVQTPTSTATGNLNLFAKYILKENKQTGSLVSVGLALSPPTAPGRFAGAPYVFGLNNTSFQPFVGYIWNKGDFYIQGFSAFAFTSSARDVTLMFNDIGIGYFAYRASDPNRFLTAVVPTFEAHVNSPFTHRDWKNRYDIAGSADVVNLTYGLNFQLQRSAIFSTALVTPVTGPRPFNAELAVFLNIFYGRSRAGRIPIQPPPVL